jgi:hypothetical protein
MSTKSASLQDVSSLLFSKTAPSMTMSEALVGPVAISNDVVHGRGLAATRDIAVGECLFITPPTASAPLGDVMRVYNSGKKKSLEELSELILLKHMKRVLRQPSKAQAASILFLTTGMDQEENLPSSSEGIALCLGQVELAQIWWKEPVADETLLEIMRHNAFGPEFHNYEQMEASFSSSSGTSLAAYHRVLGMYTLGAILNHSCQPNAVRCFAGEIMIVHACAPIAKGHEVVSSYIPPTQSYPQRQAQLQSNFDFTCTCSRCKVEQTLGTMNDQLEASLAAINRPNLRMTRNNLEPHVKYLEHVLTAGNGDITNEIGHYLRTSYLNVYLNYINASLLHSNSNNGSSSNAKKEILHLAMQLHLALSVSHNASTEHLSILHLCYDLAGDKKTFWTEQLKRAHMARYGNMGNQLEHVRQSMQHTKGILRSLDGMQRRQWAFL